MMTVMTLQNIKIQQKRMTMTDEKKPTMAIKDSGKREDFSTGSKRDTNEGKIRFDLMPVTVKYLLGAHYAFGSIKYLSRNWEKGQPIMRLHESCTRHYTLWEMGDTSENHLVGALWNMIAIIHTLLMIKLGILPPELDDRPEYMKPDNPVGRELIEIFNKDMKITLENKNAKTPKTNSD